MNKSLRTTGRFSSKPRGIRQVSMRMVLAVSLLSILSAAWGDAPPNVGIQGVINHGTCMDAYEMDDEQAVFPNGTLLVPGTPQPHNFDGNTFTGIPDKDWVRFQAAAGGVYTVTTSNLSAQADTAIKLYDANGDPVLFSSGSPVEKDAVGQGVGEQLVWAAPSAASGWYYLVVYYGSQSTGAFENCATTEVRYTLTLQGPTTQYLYLPLIMR